MLFRTNEIAFVQTKRKLLEECDLYCIISLPGGVFTSAGAGVKTNLLFFNKGSQTEHIWYYDLSDVKVGKKTPLTRGHFDEMFKLLQKRSDSPRSWTVDFTVRLQKALEEAKPHRDKAAELAAAAEEQEDALRLAKQDKKTSAAALSELEERWKASLREMREQQSRAETIENAAYDLKAVNPNRVSTEDKRTPAELLAAIEAKGREADAALLRLWSLLTV